jgi:hypothetical protein
MHGTFILSCQTLQQDVPMDQIAGGGYWE